MNRLKQLVAITIFGALACAGLHAQSYDLRATIPFAFTAGQKLMPAGEYRLHPEGQVVLVSRLDGKPDGVFVMPMSPAGEDSKETNRLVFNRYGSAYFLASIGNRRLPKTNGEKQLAKRISQPAEAPVIASKM
jgi:hypothetical protein